MDVIGASRERRQNTDARRNGKEWTIEQHFDLGRSTKAQLHSLHIWKDLVPDSSAVLYMSSSVTGNGNNKLTHMGDASLLISATVSEYRPDLGGP
jgi:hypothetical protein